jgi:TfdA family taurine catabolism dioxygenase TauD
VTSDTYLSFGEQALHYFQRPHEDVRRTSLDVPAAWRGPEIAASCDWSMELSAAHLDEIERAMTAALRRGLPMAEMRRDDFPLPTLSAEVLAWSHEILYGRGFLLVRGMPVARWGDEGAAVAYWGLGLHLGVPGAQNPDGDLLGHVIDLGEEAAQPFVRRYRTAGDIAYHCDLADAVGLLCLRTARRGGASRIVSSVSVYNELLRRRPDLVDRLYEPFLLDTRNEEGDGRPSYVPVPPCRFAGGVLRTFYHSDYFRSVMRHPEVPRFAAREQELLDLYEEIANSPALYLDMQFEPGDIQLLSNHFVLHARTAYEDDADPAHKRHLLRLWLSLPGS